MMLGKEISLILCQEDLAESSESPVESIKRIAESEVKKQRTLELAIVKNIYPHKDKSDNENYECDVQLKNGGSELRKVPILTSRLGLTWVPNINDLVLIGYIGGNANAPIVMGCLHNDEQRPPTNKAGELVYVSPDGKDAKLKRMYFRFPSGLALLVKDDMVRVTAGKLILTIRSDGEMKIDHDTGKAVIAIDPKADNISLMSDSINLGASLGTWASQKKSISISADKNVSIDSQNDSIMISTFMAGKSISISAKGGDISIEGMNVKIAADTLLEISAPTVKVDGKALTEIKGGVVKIN